jgi:hypothetical protein
VLIEAAAGNRYGHRDAPMVLGSSAGVSAYVDLAILGGLERRSLARAVRDAFPESQLAADVANAILQ